MSCSSLDYVPRRRAPYMHMSTSMFFECFYHPSLIPRFSEFQLRSSSHSSPGHLVLSVAACFATALFLRPVSYRFYPASPSVSRDNERMVLTFLILCTVISALELTSRNILCGSVRMVYAIIYTLFLVLKSLQLSEFRTLILFYDFRGSA